MKPFLMTLVSLFSASLFIQQVNAQDSDNSVSSLLWEISGNGLNQSSYLYGTIHMICEDDYFEPEGLDNAFAGTDQLIVEIDITDPKVMMDGMRYSMLPKGVTLETLLSEEDYARLDAFFKEEVNMSLGMLKTMKPFMLSQFMITPFIECAAPASYEEKFIARSKADEESVKGLETIAEVMGVIDSIPHKRQAEMMIESLDAMEEMGEEFSFSDMIAAYKSQDLNQLMSFLEQFETDDDVFNELLLEKRNLNWMDDITGYITEMPSLVAVGAGHLPGEEGLIKLLRGKGYTVTAVK